MYGRIPKSVFVVFIAILGFGAVATAGSLTPPSAVSSTMNSLADIYDSIVGTFDSSAITADQNGSLIQHLKYIESNLVPGGITSNSLDFDEFVNSMTLDADTSITGGSFSLTFDRLFIDVPNDDISRELNFSRGDIIDWTLLARQGEAGKNFYIRNGPSGNDILAVNEKGNIALNRSDTTPAVLS